LAGNVSMARSSVHSPTEFELTDYAVKLWRGLGHHDEALPSAFVTARDLPVDAHLEMQAALQAHVDNAISKTVNVPEACSFEAFRQIYEIAYDKRLKGCTAYRPNPLHGAVLQGGEAAVNAPHCCSLERETD
jgi:ribonucleoside-diphosphate reductase alpha chain